MRSAILAAYLALENLNLQNANPSHRFILQDSLLLPSKGKQEESALFNVFRPGSVPMTFLSYFPTADQIV